MKSVPPPYPNLGSQSPGQMTIPGSPPQSNLQKSSMPSQRGGLGVMGGFASDFQPGGRFPSSFQPRGPQKSRPPPQPQWRGAAPGSVNDLRFQQRWGPNAVRPPPQPQLRPQQVMADQLRRENVGMNMSDR